ncbi:hypothetical protein ACFL0F_02165, partial [Patescibacteria group bacterium]
MATKKTRINFGKEESNLPKLDLIRVQKDSWEWFLDKAIAKEIEEISPIDDFTGKNWQLLLQNPSLGEDSLTARKALEKGLTYSAS